MSHAIALVVRVAAAVLGGYAFTAAWVALASTALPRATGWARSEAVLLSGLLGFVVYLVALIWAFAERAVWRVWAVFIGGGALAVALTLTVKAA